MQVEPGDLRGNTMRAALGLLPRRRPETLPELELEQAGVLVDRDHLAAYDRVCGFRLSDNLPATYPHVLAFPMAMRILTAPNFPFPAIGLVHIANTATVHRPLTAETPYDLSVRATNLRPHDRGRQVNIQATATVNGEPVWTSVSTYLSRSSNKSPSTAPGRPPSTASASTPPSTGPASASPSTGPASASPSTAAAGAAPSTATGNARSSTGPVDATPSTGAGSASSSSGPDGARPSTDPSRAPLSTGPAGASPSSTGFDGESLSTDGLSGSEGGAEPSAVWRVPARVGGDYAAVSGDRNPIHTSRIGARLFGFPRPIAHGMWSVARCLAALEGRLPDAYTVEVRFQRPILLPATVSLAYDDGRFALFGRKPHLAGQVTPA
ncbi:MaoC family dehydratase [Paractinoplanes pyxinae]|uniref:MaoC family dehydratase n=1 Tax=Paractinoplanes pyxinae TaxID=2997416 RepID=UPI003F68F1A0